MSAQYDPRQLHTVLRDGEISDRHVYGEGHAEGRSNHGLVRGLHDHGYNDKGLVI